MKTRLKNGFHAIDFPLGSKSANLAEITLTKRYPQTGFALNKKSEMQVYILKGKVAFNNGKQTILRKGKAVRVKSNTQYFWQPLEHVTMLVYCTPPWTPKQHRHIKK